MRKEWEKNDWDRSVLSQITNDACAYILSSSGEKCAEIAYNVYKTGWDEGFPEKPSWWDKLPFELNEKFYDTVRKFIDMKIGVKGAERYIYKKDYGCTDQEFDDMWDSLVAQQIHDHIDKYIKDTDCRRNNNTQNKKFFIQPLLFFGLGIVVGAFLSAFFL